MTIKQSRSAIAATGLRKPFGDQIATDRTPIHELVGKDPVEFAATIPRNHQEGQQTIQERQRLTNAIKRAAGEDIASEERAV